MKRFEGKAVVVTGAASGIGLAAATRFAAEGAGVVLADINLNRAADAAREIAAAHGVPTHALAFDACNETQCTTLVAQAVAALGQLDVLINSAGIMGWSRAEDYPADMFDRVLKINLYGLFYVSRAALPHLLRTGGCIVNLSSAAGLQGVPYAAAYCASKAGILGITRSMAVEYADRGVRINAICPGGVDTPMNSTTTPVPDWADLMKIARLAPKTGKMSAPGEIAAACVYLASADAVNITGIALSIDGGQVAG